jgi:hypothetical protein
LVGWSRAVNDCVCDEKHRGVKIFSIRSLLASSDVSDSCKNVGNKVRTKRSVAIAIVSQDLLFSGIVFRIFRNLDKCS